MMAPTRLALPKVSSAFAFILIGLVAAVPQGALQAASPATYRPKWAAETDSSNFPVEVEAIVFMYAKAIDVLDRSHPVRFGRWMIDFGPEKVVERLRLARQDLCRTTSTECFFARIDGLRCVNPAVPALSICTLSLEWGPAIVSLTSRTFPDCVIYVASTTAILDDLLNLKEPPNQVAFRIPCPEDIRIR